jgi:hypothetical protein
MIRLNRVGEGNIEERRSRAGDRQLVNTLDA